MPNAGASVEAYLRLNATEFKSGLETAVAAVEKFKTSMLDIGKEGRTLSTGMNQVSQALKDMIEKMTLLDTVDSKSIAKMKELGLAMEHMSVATQRFGSDARRGAEGMERLNTVMEIFEAGVSSAEVTINATVRQLERLTRGSNSANSSVQRLEATFTGLSSAVNPAKMSLVDYGKIERNAYLEGQRQKTNLEQLQREFMNLAKNVEAYNSIHSSSVQREINDLNRLQAELKETQIIRRLSNNDRMIKITPSSVTIDQATASLKAQSQAMRENASETLRNMGYKGRLSAEEAQVRANSYSASAATQQYTNSLNRSTTATQRQATATRTLGKALSSLRMIGTMVGSMMVWNFAHSLITATRETVNAKSEMEGYFKMLNFGQRDIDHFNQALNNTVQQFQRVNKYSLGETISSIGVEFDLTTKEMEKAMKVTSMITSEYLRAGRNANEASLAVKDVLQGQFQRLSRETGVKGEQLKEAGWSGDTNDVLGLMDALEKVGMSRNWDVFAEKANSLNDIVTILQNRFGEWSAEMVNVVQPSIVGAFNAIMSVGVQLGGLLGRMWEWLNGDGLVNQAVKWTGIATAIGTVYTALVTYRTGANLAQLAQMGLRGSIMATIFGLKAEEVATYGSRNAIVAKITSLKAEEVATLGVRRALVTQALGLDSVIVRQKGLKGAIMASTFANQLYEASLKGATAEEMKSIYMEQQAQLSKMGTLRAIFAKIAGVNLETFAERGLIVALAERIAQSPLYIGSLKAEEVAELSTAEAAFVLMGSIAPLVAIFIGLAVAIYGVIKPLMDASEEMKKFKNLVDNGDEVIKSYKSDVDSLTKSKSALEEKLNSLEKGTQEYKRVQDEVASTTKDLETANENYKNSIKAVEMARSRQAKFEEEKSKIAIHNQTLLKDAYISAGISATEASQLASHELQEAERGAEQLRHALQMLKLEADKGAEKNKNIIGILDQYGLDDETIKKYGTNMSEAQYKIAEGMEKFMTSDDLLERISGWAEIQQGRLEEWWTELNAFFEVRDWSSIGKKLQEGFTYIMDTLHLSPIWDFLRNIGDEIADKGIIKYIMDALFGEGDSDGIVDIISQWGNECIVQPLGEWLSWFMDDPIGHFNQINFDLSLALAKFLFGKNTTMSTGEMAWEWFYDTVTRPIQEAFNDFVSDPLKYIGSAIGNGLLSSLLPTLLFGGDVMDIWTGIQEWFNTNVIQPIVGFFTNLDILAMFTSGGMGNGMGMKQINISSFLSAIISIIPDDIGLWVNASIITPLQNGIVNGIANIPIIGTLAQLLGLVPQQDQNAYIQGYNLIDWFKQGVEKKIGEIPIVGDIARMLGLIPQQNPNAYGKGHGVGENIKKGESDGHRGIAENVAIEMGNIIGAISKSAQQVYDTAHDVGSQILNGIKDALDMHSPSIISRELLANEFGKYIPESILSGSEVAYQSAMYYGQRISDGISSVNTNVSLDGMVGEYQDDAQIVASSSQLMGSTTTTAFNQMQTSVNATTTQMTGNVTSSYSAMQQKQATLLNNMKASNTTAYNEMYTKSNQSLLHMRDSTANVTHQMTNAWNHMKDQIVASANRLKSESTSHFNQLSSTIGTFYRKIQNPSNWGAGSPNIRSSAPRPSKGRTALRTIRGASRHGAGINPYQSSESLTLRDLLRMTGVSDNTKMDLNTFLASIWGEHGFGWNDWHGRHFNYIKNTSDQWSMKPPMIMGYIPAGNGFKVGEFEGGEPHITWSTFMSTAEALFSTIPYKFYWDSNWKGDWVSALKAGATNCSDGSDALIALAQTMGFSGTKVHTTTRSGLGHFYAVINGKKMDTTNFQHTGSWTPLGAGIPTRAYGRSTSGAGQVQGKTVNVTVDMSNSTIYGVDDLDSRIQEGVQKGLQEEFNDPYTVAI